MITRLQKVTIAVTILLQSVVFSVSGSPFPDSETDHFRRTQSIFDQINNGSDVLEVTIRTDLGELIDNRRREEYQKADFIYEDVFGSEVKWNVEVKPRGKFRRRVCDFPPFKVKFNRDLLASQGLDREYNKLKMVTHCLDDRYDGKENLLKEYLTYKIYQLLNDEHYRVRLMRITYIDTKGKISKIKRYGFLIEDTDEMAHRAGGTECECMNPDPSTIATSDENIMAMFQFMIGNADWKTSMLRNVKLVKPIDGSEIVIVPYDFDFAGIVNTSYALPNADYGLTDVQQRIYLGQPVSDEMLESTIAVFLSRKDEILQLIDNFKELSRAGRNDMIDYVESFYDMIDEVLRSEGESLQDMLKNNSPVDSSSKSGVGSNISSLGR